MNSSRFLSISLLVFFCTSLMAQSVADIHKDCYKLLRTGKYEQVKEIAERLLLDGTMSNDDRSETYYIIGSANRKQNLFAESLAYYERAISITSSSDKKAKIYNNIIGSLIYMNLNSEAIREADKAIELSELWAPVSLYNKSLAQINLEEYAAASKTLEEGLKVCDELENHYYKAKIYNQYGLMEKNLYEYSNMESHAKLAAQYFGYALEIKENEVEQGKAHHYFARLKLLQQDSIGATEQFKLAIAKQTNKQYLFYSMRDYSEYLLSVGNEAEARPLIDSALAIFPTITLSGETLKIFFLAQDIGYRVPMFRTHFDSYVEQREKTEVAYAAYIGRQIQRENVQKARDRNQTITIAITVILSVLLLITVFVYRRKITSSYKFIKKFE